MEVADMDIFYKLFKQDPDTREGVITTTSGIGVVANIAIALIKMIAGTISSSIAIISEGVNNLADAMTSILTLIGSKLALKHPDEKHPFGYGRIEYLTSLVVSIMILVSGIEVLTSAVKLIFNPEPVNISILSLIIVAITAFIKYFLGTYTIKMGKKIESGSLEAVGGECRGDSFASIITIVAALAFILFKINIDAYAGIATSLLIIKAGGEVLIDTIHELIGRPGKKELAQQLYKEIRGTKGIINAVDMMLHNYGPDAYSGSVNVELDHNMDIGEAYDFLHALQLKIMHEYHVTMVFGIYAVDNDSKTSRSLREYIALFVRNHEHVKSYHAVYIDKKSDKLYCDLIVDYDLHDWDGLRQEFKEYMAKKYPKKDVILTIETEFV